MLIKAPTDVVRQVPVDRIRPGSQQARRHFDADSLGELAESIRESGVVQPIVLRSQAWGYELLAGERRWRAAQQAGLHEIPALIRDDLSDAEAFVIGLVENLQRESLTPMEAAAGIKRLGEVFSLTHEQIGLRIGKSREYVSNALRLLHLAPAVAALVNQGRINPGHAKILAGLPQPDQVSLADEVIRQRLSVRALERRVVTLRAAIAPALRKNSDWQALEREVSDQLGYSASINAEPSGSGELKLRFHSLEELEGLLARIGYRGN